MAYITNLEQYIENAEVKTRRKLNIMRKLAGIQGGYLEECVQGLITITS
jgi:hypothetical protein